MRHTTDYLGQLKNIRLTDSERTVMRARLQAYASLNPAAASLPVRAWGWVFRHGIASASMAAVLILAGTGVSAGSSRPGDTLYGFRLFVNDRIETVLAVGDDARIDVEMAQLQRMIDDEDSLRSDVLTELAYAGTADIDRELEAELAELERELNSMAEFDDTDSYSENDELEAELEDIERQLREAERDAAELE